MGWEPTRTWSLMYYIRVQKWPFGKLWDRSRHTEDERAVTTLLELYTTICRRTVVIYWNWNESFEVYWQYVSRKILSDHFCLHSGLTFEETIAVGWKPNYIFQNRKSTFRSVLSSQFLVVSISYTKCFHPTKLFLAHAPVLTRIFMKQWKRLFMEHRYFHPFWETA